MNGKLRQATSVLLHLIGAAAGFADLLKGSARFTGGAGKVRMLCGVQSSNEKLSSKLRRTHEESAL